MKLLDRVRGKLNVRQEKAILRMLEEGPEGFKDGMSAGKYATIANASRATATRDLAELVELEVLTRWGELKGTRYALKIPLRIVGRVTIDESGGSFPGWERRGRWGRL